MTKASWRSLTEANRARLLETIKRQLSQLAFMLGNEQRDQIDLHYLAAPLLRAMLCDPKWPTLLVLAADKDVDARVWGPYPISVKHERAPAFSMNALVGSSTPVANAFEMSLAEFVDAPIGAVAGEWYTPRTLIKALAEREGSAHFDPKPKAPMPHVAGAIKVEGTLTLVDAMGRETLVSNNDDALLRVTMIQLMRLALDVGARLRDVAKRA